MKDAAEAEFVVFGSVGQGSPMAYVNHNGDLVEITGARTYGFEEAMQVATEMAGKRGASMYVAPLLFGVPDVESQYTVSPPAND